MIELSLKGRSRQELFERLILLFMCFQIIIDLLTTLSVKVLDISLSIGMMARFGFMAFGVVYVFMYGKKSMKILTTLLAVLIVGHIAYAYLGLKGPLFTNVRYYLRAAVFPISIIVFYTMFQTTKEDKKELFWTFMKILNTLVFTVGVVFILSTLTRTGFNMYGKEKFRTGTSSWFLSGNEISSSMIILLTVPAINYIKKKSWFNVATLILQVFTIAALGTKSSLFLFVLLLFIIAMLVIISLMRKQYNLPQSIVLFAVVCLFGIFAKQIPAVKNILWQSDYKAYISMYASQVEGGEIPEEISSNHSTVPFEFAGDYIGSLKIAVSKEQMAVSGYFYPKYYDLGHPNYVKKVLVFTDSDGVQTELLLNDTYNRNIPNDREDEFSSAFSGVSGVFSSEFLRIDRAYTLSMRVQVDDIYNEYPLYYGAYYSQTLFEKKISLRENGTIWVSYNYDYDPFTSDQQQLDLSGQGSNVDVSFLNMWLSGRNSRLATFIGGVDITIPKAIVGTGYVSNYKIGTVKGLEMDFVELAITFGILGFILYFSMYFFCIFSGLKSIIKKHGFKSIFRTVPLLIICGLGVSAASAFVVGHTILTPSVSINVALMVVLFYVYCTEDKTHLKEEKDENPTSKN